MLPDASRLTFNANGLAFNSKRLTLNFNTGVFCEIRLATSVRKKVCQEKGFAQKTPRAYTIGATPDGRLTKEAWSWQGGGCRTTDDRGIKADTPKYKKLGLNQRGWRIVREIDETAGMCPRLKEYLFEEEWNMLVEWWRERRKARGVTGKEGER